jgi:hypothetical protein
MYTCTVEHTVPAECMETLPKDNPVPRLYLQEADHTFERLRIGNDVQILQLLVGVQPTAGGDGGPRRRGDHWYRPGGSRHRCSAQLRRPLCGTGKAAGPLKGIAQRACGALPTALGGAVRNSGSLRRVLFVPCCCCRRNSADFQVFVVVLPFAVLLWWLCCRIRRFCRSWRRLCFRGFFLVGGASLLVVCIDLCLSVLVVV